MYLGERPIRYKCVHSLRIVIVECVQNNPVANNPRTFMSISMDAIFMTFFKPYYSFNRTLLVESLTDEHKTKLIQTMKWRGKDGLIYNGTYIHVYTQMYVKHAYFTFRLPNTLTMFSSSKIYDGEHNFKIICNGLMVEPCTGDEYKLNTVILYTRLSTFIYVYVNARTQRHLAIYILWRGVTKGSGAERIARKHSIICFPMALLKIISPRW